MMSRIQIAAVTALAAVGLVTVVSASASDGRPAIRGPGQLPCTAVLRPDTVHISQMPVTLGWTFSEDIGRLETILSPEDSGLQVTAFSIEDGTLELDSSSALEGRWTLTFSGDEQRTCVGTVNVLLGGH